MHAHVLPEALQTFGETDDVLDHVSCEVGHVRKSGKNAPFTKVLAHLGLLCSEGMKGGGGGGG